MNARADRGPGGDAAGHADSTRGGDRAERYAGHPEPHRAHRDGPGGEHPLVRAGLRDQLLDGGGPRGGVGKILADEQMRLLIVLHHHDANPGERFSERRTGLDHVGLSVANRAELEAWQRHLQELGVTQSPIADRPYGSVLVFRDPDNIQLELFAPPNS